MSEYDEEVWKGMDQHLDSLDSELEKESLIIYKRALDEVRNILTQNFLKYGQLEQLSISEMYKFNRLGLMEEQIVQIINDMTDAHLKTITGSLRLQFQEALNTTYFAVAKQAGVNLRVPLLDKKLMEHSINNPITGIKLPDTMNVNRAQSIRNIKRTLTQSMIQGKNLRKVSQDLSDEFGFAYEKARRIAKTEGTRVRATARLESMKEINSRVGGGLKKRWVSTKDMRTRKDHQHLDGKETEIDGEFEIHGMKTDRPGHFVGSKSASENINCRCNIVTITPNTVLDKMRALDVETGRQVIMEHMTYPEWKKSQGLT